MSKLIKRKDGSYSKRGLWDNIRANKGSGKEPTKEMLKQESKIKKEENMNSMYKKGGKTSKSKMKKPMPSFMEESKEMEFGAPGVKPPMKKMMMGGGTETGMQVNGRMNRAMGEATMAGNKKMLEGGRRKSKDGDYVIRKSLQDREDTNEKVEKMNKFMSKDYPTFEEFNNTSSPDFMYKRRTLKGALTGAPSVENADNTYRDKMMKAVEEGERRARSKKTGGKKMMYKKGGFPDLNNDNEITFGDVLKGRLKGSNPKEKMMGGKMEYKKGGKKTMEPGGGGRFAKMVSGLKKEGKSEESAEAIAASIGRKKYGKSNFQAMAAAGKKKMGGKMC